jgi:putative tryptophan/tyrosine transport system substrate-binding protein
MRKAVCQIKHSVCAGVLVLLSLLLGALTTALPAHAMRVLYLDMAIPGPAADVKKIEVALTEIMGARANTVKIIVGELPASEVPNRAAILLARVDQAAADLIVCVNQFDVAIIKKERPQQRVLFLSSYDPLAQGLVKNLATPGGNISGISLAGPVWYKQLEFLRDCFPATRRLGVLLEIGLAKELFDKADLNPVATQFGFTLIPVTLNSSADAKTVNAAMNSIKPEAWLLPASQLTLKHRTLINEIAAQQKAPAIFDRKRAASKGAPITLDHQSLGWQRLIAKQISLIDQGVSIGEIPIETPRKFISIINIESLQKSAITLKKSCIAQADYYEFSEAMIP